MSASAPGMQVDSTQNLCELLADKHTWEKYTLYGESIPHLLHWDWAYLWLLARNSVQPDSWRDRIEAWRRLLCMLLLSELEFDAQPIRQPLLSYTSSIGLTDVVFLRAPQVFKDVPIGVLSPTVLVRPLPEPNRFGIPVERIATELPKHYDPPPSSRDDRRAELAQMLDLAKKTIADSGSTFASKLLAVIERNLIISRFTPTTTHFDPIPLSCGVPLLPAADATAWDGMQLKRLPLQVSMKGGRQRYVPRCSQVNCRAPLTYTVSEPAIDALAGVRLKCRSCEAETTIPLAEFGIWQYENTYYVWTGLHELPERPIVPPTPNLVDNEIHFLWHSISLGGENNRVHLRLRFPNHHVRSVSVADIRYGSLLVPGEFGGHVQGYPIRPEWLFAVEKMPDIEISGEVLTFRRMKLRGIKDELTLGRYPRAACTVAPDLQVGMFPGPMYPGWLRYRFYWSGAQAGDYRACIVPAVAKGEVKKASSVGIAEWNAGLPQAIAVEAKIQGEVPAPVGATWLLPAPRTPSAIQQINLGIDFGTTNTVVFASTPNLDEPVCFKLSDLLIAARLIAGTGEPRASFLPPMGGATPNGVDPSLIPSAIWVATDEPYSPIRWSDQPPSPGHRRYGRFKWAPHLQEQRIRYLDELLFLALPVALRKLFPHADAKANWNLGFAFPLAFSEDLRAQYRDLFTKVRETAAGYTSGTVELRDTNESYACVNAFGLHEQGRVFLIADLGGGSLDVALFEVAASQDGHPVPKLAQVGSARIGGETFLSVLAERMGEQTEDHHYWKIRDAIMTGRVSSEFPQAGFETVASRFLPIVQELLRVMVAAYRAKFPQAKVELVLAGNGWRIAEFTGSVARAQTVARDDLEQSFQLFAIPNFSVYGGLGIPPKHLVALGALENAKPGGQFEIRTSVNQSQMPAGRDMRLTNAQRMIQWSELVGINMEKMPPGTGPAHIEIVRTSGPEAPQMWQQQLDYAMPGFNTDPDDPYIRGKLAVSGQRLERGPLQVILEKRAGDLK